LVYWVIRFSGVDYVATEPDALACITYLNDPGRGEDQRVVGRTVATCQFDSVTRKGYTFANMYPSYFERRKHTMIQYATRRSIVLLVAILGLALFLAACSGSKDVSQTVKLKLAPVSQLPQDIQRGDPKVVEAYQFAVANQEYLAQFPCYCGCGGMGHKSNADCYIRQVKPDGSIDFETHAFF